MECRESGKETGETVLQRPWLDLEWRVDVLRPLKKNTLIFFLQKLKHGRNTYCSLPGKRLPARFSVTSCWVTSPRSSGRRLFAALGCKAGQAAGSSRSLSRERSGRRPGADSRAAAGACAGSSQMRATGTSRGTEFRRGAVGRAGSRAVGGA